MSPTNTFNELDKYLVVNLETGRAVQSEFTLGAAMLAALVLNKEEKKNNRPQVFEVRPR